VTVGRKEQRYRAAFEASGCENCPLFDPCPTQPLKCQPENVLRFSQQELDLALRRKRSADARATRQNLRSAVEATVRAVKHPFGNGKVPVRGKPRVSMVALREPLSASSGLSILELFQWSQKMDSGSFKSTSLSTHSPNFWSLIRSGCLGKIMNLVSSAQLLLHGTVPKHKAAFLLDTESGSLNL
jgi:hypothetical protein